jgi:xanthine phosphoribosyltransferase
VRGPQTEVGWDEIDRLADVLARAACADGAAYDRVVAVARGGLVPGALLAARLGVRRVEAVQVRHYDDAERRAQPLVVGEPPRRTSASGEARTLVVDDVLETGATLRVLAALLPGAAFAVLVVKAPGARVRADGAVVVDVPPGGAVVGARAAPSDRWVVFPWSGARERTA